MNAHCIERLKLLKIKRPSATPSAVMNQLRLTKDQWTVDAALHLLTVEAKLSSGWHKPAQLLD